MAGKTIKTIKTMLVVFGALVLCQAVALADLQVTGSTTGVFSATGNKTWNDLAFTDSTFNVKVPIGGTQDLSLGHFDLGTSSDFYIGQDAFKLTLKFTAPPSLPNTDFTADILGLVQWHMGAALLFFDNWEQTFNYSGATGSGSFTLSLYPTDIVGGHDMVTILAGGHTDLTARIENVTSTSTTVPEPQVIALLGTMLLGLGLWQRKQLRKLFQ